MRVPYECARTLAACRTHVSIFVCADNKCHASLWRLRTRYGYPRGMDAILASIPQSRGAPRAEGASGGRQGVHSLHVPRHGDEAPLTLDIVEAAQKELAKAHHRFD